jgi:hypothetical protein
MAPLRTRIIALVRLLRFLRPALTLEPHPGPLQSIWRRRSTCSPDSRSSSSLASLLALLYSIDWEALSPHVIALVLMLGFLYWTTTLLPGPIRKVGKAAGKQAMKSIRKSK